MIPYGRQSVDDADIAAVVEVLRGDWLTQGPHVDAFEDRLCEITNARFAVAFSSGTAALHAAAHAAGLGPGDTVHTSPLTFAASANAAIYVGATPGLVDIDPATLNIDLAAVPPHADALVAVHYAGLPLDLTKLPDRPRVVIEDAAHAIGAHTPDGPVGNCARSDLCCFSFHPVKTVTTGEGGAVTTNDAELAARLRRFRHHGIEPLPNEGPWVYDIPEPGFNYRLTDLQAALGTSQLAKLERFVARRNELASQYRERLAALPIVLPPPAPPGVRHGYHLFPIQVAERARVVSELRARGIGVQVHYVPIHRFTAYKSFGLRAEDFPNCEAVYAGLLSLPLYPAMSDADLETVATTLEDVL